MKQFIYYHRETYNESSEVILFWAENKNDAIAKLKSKYHPKYFIDYDELFENNQDQNIINILK